MFCVLVVCTANICRSPAGERLLRAGLAGAGVTAADVDVTSAGVNAVDGRPPCDLSLALSGEFAARTVHQVPPGVLSSHRSRRLTVEHLTAADVVLTADRGHRAAVARLLPSARTRTFTLTEAARLAADLDAVLGSGRLPDGAPPPPDDGDGRRRWLVAELDAARGLRPRPEHPAAWWHPDDVPDPHAVGYETHGVAVERIAAAVEVLVGVLTATPP